MAKAAAAGQATYVCVATGCGKRYDPRRTRAGLRGLCSQACQDALAKELGWRRSSRSRPTQYSVVRDELHRRRASVPGADTRDIVDVRVLRAEAEAEAETEQQAMARVRPWHVAEAFQHVARVNHYMVQVAPGFTGDELDAAEQVLIAQQNALGASEGDLTARRRFDLALDLVEHRRKDMQRLTFRHGTRGRTDYEHTALCIYTRVRTCLELHPGDADEWCVPCTDVMARAGKVRT